MDGDCILSPQNHFFQSMLVSNHLYNTNVLCIIYIGDAEIDIIFIMAHINGQDFL